MANSKVDLNNTCSSKKSQSLKQKNTFQNILWVFNKTHQLSRKLHLERLGKFKFHVMLSTIVQWGVILIIIYFLVMTLLKGKSNPKLPAIVFLALGILTLIGSFSMANKHSGQGLNIPSNAENVVMLVGLIFLIISAFFFYKTSKKKNSSN